MKKVVGINFIKSKNDVGFVILHLVDDAFVDTVNHIDLFASEPKTAWGESVSTEFVLQDDLKYGNVEIIGGDLRPGCFVRVLKENINGLDRVSVIQVINKPEAESFNGVENGHGFDVAPEKSAAKTQPKK